MFTNDQAFQRVLTSRWPATAKVRVRLSNEVASTRFQTGENTEYSGFGELLSIEDNLRSYNADIVAKIASYFEAKSSVLEFGAGIGTLAIEWHKQTGAKPECLEINAKQQRMIVERGFTCYPSIDAPAKKFDGIYSSNVLEHIEDDLGVLKELRSIMSDGAVLAVYVPAFMHLYSEIDRSLGHYRRYRRSELIAKARRAGFQPIDCYYADSIGYFAWFGAKLSARKRTANPAGPASLRFYDKWVYPVSRALDALFMRRVAGKSLLLIARK
jgi:SAM-dependent methyltransferase